MSGYLVGDMERLIRWLLVQNHHNGYVVTTAVCNAGTREGRRSQQLAAPLDDVFKRTGFVCRLSPKGCRQHDG